MTEVVTKDIQYVLDHLFATEMELVSAKVALDQLDEQWLWRQLNLADIIICLVQRQLMKRGATLRIPDAFSPLS